MQSSPFVFKGCAPYSDSFSELTKALKDLGTFKPVAECIVPVFREIHLKKVVRAVTVSWCAAVCCVYELVCACSL